RDQAIADYTKAIDIVPSYVAAYNNRGNAYLRAGLREKAIADFTKAIEVDPKNALAYNNRAWTLRKSGSPPKVFPMPRNPFCCSPRTPAPSIHADTSWKLLAEPM